MTTDRTSSQKEKGKMRLLSRAFCMIEMMPGFLFMRGRLKNMLTGRLET